MPRFSIVMPCYNAETTLQETLASIMAQRFGDWELICVDDGSTDQTWPMLRAHSYKDQRIKAIQNPGKGPSSARNHAALMHAEGEIIAFCDADDLWTPQKLSALHRSFDENSADALFAQIGFFDYDPEVVRAHSTVPAGPLKIETLLGENPVCTLSNIAIRRDSFMRFGGFDPSVVHNEDLEWLIRLVGQGALIQGLDEFQVRYRASPHGLSADLEAMAKGRLRAVETAARYGVHAPKSAEAVHHRYLARRALRMGHPRFATLQHAVNGLAASPKGFMSPPRRGAMTLIAATTNLVLPRAISRALFS